jgi:hypothetical protein
VRRLDKVFGTHRHSHVPGVVTVEVMLGVMDVMGSWASTGCGVKDFCHRPGGFKT